MPNGRQGCGDLRKRAARLHGTQGARCVGSMREMKRHPGHLIWRKDPGGAAPKRSNQPLVAKVLGLSVAELVSGRSNVGRRLDVRVEAPLASEVEARANVIGVVREFTKHFR